MRDRYVVNLAHLAMHKPRWLVGANLSKSKLWLVSAYGVICKRGAFAWQRNYLAERYKTKLDKSLEAVAYTNHKTVTGIEHILYSILDLRIAEECVDKFSRAFGFVTAWETAGNSYHLAVFDSLCKFVYAVFHILCRKVSDNEYFSFTAVSVECGSHIVFAVSTGEYGDKYLRLCDSAGSLVDK